MRFTQRSNTDGSIVRYVALDVGGLLRLAASIRKHFGEDEPSPPGGGAAAQLVSDAAEAGLAAGTTPMEVLDSRPIGGCRLLDGLWSQLHVGAAIKKAGDGRRFTTNMERVLFALSSCRPPNGSHRLPAPRGWPLPRRDADA